MSVPAGDDDFMAVELDMKVHGGAYHKERASPTEADALLCSCESDDGYCFGAHLLVAASHTPPAFVQSASVLAAVGSPAPAKAGPVKANARARASIETRPFMAFSPLR